MNFFEHQDQARRKTGHLVFLFILAVLSLIALTNVLVVGVLAYLNGVQVNDVQAVTGYFSWSTLFTIAGVIGGVVLLASLYKLSQLSAGGRVVAEAMGGRLLNTSTRDANERKLLNVVEEMAIASGTPVPPVYLIEESGINAFAAGYRPSDAVIGITRGCMELLDRDELQGVIAHEFSHILHGDMKLNIRLIGVLHGILVIGIIGYFLLRSVSRTGYGYRSRSSKNNNTLPLLALGGGLMVIGYTGTFFGNWIKAAVSRQREFLADSSAVQFTRNPTGISGALKKIGGYQYGSQIEDPEAAEISHLFFGQAIQPFFGRMMATHPPLNERIKRIEPKWDGRFPITEKVGPAVESMQSDQASGFSQAQVSQTGVSQPIEGISGEQAPASLMGNMGVPVEAHLAFAHQLLGSLPDDIRQAAHESFGARALVYCLLLDPKDEVRAKQWQQLEKNADSTVYQLAKGISGERAMTAEFRLPLLELCLPALTQLSPEQYQRFKTNVIALMQADQKIELFEWALYRVMMHQLEPPRFSLGEIGSVGSIHMVGKACGVVLSAVAGAGVETEGEAQASFKMATEMLGLPRLKYISADRYSMQDLSRAVSVLNRLKPLQKPKLLKALCACVTHDGVIKPLEVELIRALAVSLDCPMPPLVTEN